MSRENQISSTCIVESGRPLRLPLLKFVENEVWISGTSRETVIIVNNRPANAPWYCLPALSQIQLLFVYYLTCAFITLAFLPIFYTPLVRTAPWASFEAEPPAIHTADVRRLSASGTRFTRIPIIVIRVVRSLVPGAHLERSRVSKFKATFRWLRTTERGRGRAAQFARAREYGRTIEGWIKGVAAGVSIGFIRGEGDSRVQYYC